MTSFMEASRTALASMGRKLAERIVHGLDQIASDMDQMAQSQYRQPLRLIPGMPAASEPCLLPQVWSADLHPKNAVAHLKVDGIRALHIDTSIVSREALPLDCALHCLPALHELEKRYGEPMVFDGEYAEPGGFQATIAAMRRGEGVGTIWLFDAVPYREWSANRFTERLDRRHDRLAETVNRLDLPFINWLPLMHVPTADDALALAEKTWARGNEGIVVKDALSLYYRGKSRSWLKLKKKQTFDGIIVDALVKDGRCQALMVRMPPDSPSPGKVVRIGSNIPDEMRDAIGRTQGSFIGNVAEIGFTDTTDTGNLRGGYFVRMRDDKKGDHDHG
jgi:ATP-dependent DNA ligase